MTTAPYERARRLQAEGSFGEAAEAYARALEADPGDFRAHHNLAVVLQELGRPAEAEAEYERALAVHPGAAYSAYNLARLRHLDGRLELAEAGYRQAVGLDPELSEAHFNLGRLLLERGEPVEAETRLRSALGRAPEEAAVQSLLGDSLFAQRRMDEALAAYRRTGELDPGDAATAFDEGKTLEFMHRAGEAIECYRRCLELEPRSVAAREALARALAEAGRRDEAVASLEAWLAAEPDHPTARHALAALGCCEPPARASDGYVRATFDRFAADFDVTLARLDYRAPHLLAAALALALGEPRPELDVLDAGCGTGLCGPFLRPWARRLEGVDLSPGMIERARRRGDYDALHVAELTAFLDARPGAWDLVAAADTLCYFGALEPPIAAAARALRPGGLLAFTVEALEADGAWGLGPHGRYAHGRAYVLDTLAALGLDATAGRAGLRNEDGRPVAGFVVTARRQSKS